MGDKRASRGGGRVEELGRTNRGLLGSGQLFQLQKFETGLFTNTNGGRRIGGHASPKWLVCK